MENLNSIKPLKFHSQKKKSSQKIKSKKYRRKKEMLKLNLRKIFKIHK